MSILRLPGTSEKLVVAFADLFDRLKSTSPSQPQVQEQSRRANQGPAINEAQVTGDEALNHPPVGAMMEWAGASDPASGKWVICDGRTLSIQTYTDLYAVLSTTWNTGGEPAGDFRIPDLRSRVAVGAGQGAGLTSRSLASTFGAETHTLIVNEMPNHDHGDGTTSEHTHDHGDTELSSHFHGGDHRASWTTRLVDGGQFDNRSVVWDIDLVSENTASEDHSHDIPNDTHDHNIAPEGGGASHNNIPPSVAVHKIIRVLR